MFLLYLSNDKKNILKKNVAQGSVLSTFAYNLIKVKLRIVRRVMTIA